MTAIMMLEAVLDTDDDGSIVKRLASGRDSGRENAEEGSGDLDSEEEAHVRKMIKMITGRLGLVRKKQQMIAEVNSKAQQSQPRRQSGDMTPRSVPTHT
jgi:serine/threonine-protein kinase ULK/ATG1